MRESQAVQLPESLLSLKVSVKRALHFYCQKIKQNGE